MSDRHIYYAAQQGEHFLKLTGELRFDAGSAFEKVLSQLMHSPVIDIIILDLSEVALLDSTYLGLISQLVTKLKAGRLEAWVTNDDTAQLLRQVGFDQFFTIVFNDFPARLPANYIEFTVTERESKQHLAERVRVAHEDLVALNTENEAPFSQVIHHFKKH